ncbi:MAG: AraC family transcriptional regulator [Cytophagales bacterium]|nr:AraC family transcriptional regulator [Cytophagales bacterium]
MSKRVISFNVPKTEHELVRVQSDLEPHFYDQIHQHPEIQIMLIESGEGTLIAGDYVGRFGLRDVFVIGSGQPHVFRCDQRYYQAGSGLEARSTSLYFSEDYFGSALWHSNELTAVREFAGVCSRGFQLAQDAALSAAILIRKMEQQAGLERLLQFLTLLNHLITAPGKRQLSLQPARLLPAEEQRMNSILEFTFRESHRNIYLLEAAQIANLSVEAFCRYFKLHTRKTYINFLNEVRISHACQLLIHTDKPIEQVCYQSGFSNVSNFNRIFKKTTQKSPLGFRRQLPVVN